MTGVLEALAVIGGIIWAALLNLVSPSTIMEMLLLIIIVLSLNMEYGWTGIPNFGKVAFFSLGGLASMLSLEYIVMPALGSLTGLPPSLEEHAVAIREALARGLTPSSFEFTNVFLSHVIPLFNALPYFYVVWVGSSILLAVVLGIGFALLTGYSVVRLREDYLAITLLMGAFLLYVLYVNIPQLVGGTFGVALQINNVIAAIVGKSNVTAFQLGVLGAAALASFLFAELLLNSPYGRVLRAVRDDEAAAEAMGKNAARVRLGVLIVSNVWAALAGVLYVTVYLGSLHPDYFKPEVTFLWIAMLLLGGVGNNVGAIVGVVAFEAILNVMGGLTASFVSGGFQGPIQNMLVGLTIIAVMFLRPRGLIPEKAVATPLWDVYEAKLGPRPEYAVPWWKLRRKMLLIAARFKRLAGRRGKRSSQVS